MREKCTYCASSLSRITHHASRSPFSLRSLPVFGVIEVDSVGKCSNIRILTKLLMISGEQPKLTRNEGLKQGSPLLTGTIAETLQNPQAESFTQDDYEFLKFHGVYQQDDRDKRKGGKQYIYMVRTAFPGGTLTADQYLEC